MPYKIYGTYYVVFLGFGFNFILSPVLMKYLKFNMNH
jgi:hypothetical protein